MKKTITVLLTLLTVMLMCVPAYANSAQVYWESVPGLSVCTLDEDTPVTVESEELLFDLSSTDWSGGGKVSAAYKMNNPTDGLITSQMVFPIISAPCEFLAESVKITADGENVPYSLYIGDVVNDEQSFDLSTALKALDGTRYTPQSFDCDEQGTLYTFNIDTQRERLELSMSFMPVTGAYILSSGFFNFHTADDGTVTIGSSYIPGVTQEGDILLYVIGAELDFDISAYGIQGEPINSTEYICDVQEQKTTLASVLSDTLELALQHPQNESDVESDVWLDYYYELLDNYFIAGNTFAQCNEVLQFDYIKRTLFLTYSVDFEAGQTRDVSVTYDISATGDATQTTDYKYTYDYLLSPAANWAQFGTLNITVKTPARSPYIAQSSLPFTSDGEQLYTASFSSLPEGELSFTLYSAPEITKSDMAAKKVRDIVNDIRFFITFFWWLPVLVAAIIVNAVLSTRKNKRAKQ